MATSVKYVLLFALINVWVTVTTASSQCCTMDGLDCTWDFVPDSWQYAPGHIPDTSISAYYNFLPSAPSSSYLWIQDQTGTTSSEQRFDVTAVGTTFSFDYYFQTPDPVTGDYLHVILQNGLTNTVIASITVMQDGWRSFVITCDSSVNYCCGSYGDVPCSGTIEIAANFDVTPNKGIAAFDNFGNCGPVTTNTAAPPTTNTPIASTTNTPIASTTNTPIATSSSAAPTTTPAAPTTTPAPTTTTPAPTTTTPYTVPTPHPDPDGCCDFESDVCGFTISYPYWYWSATKTQTPPTPYIPPYDGYFYLWTDQSGAIATTSLQTIVDPLHTFSINYYLYNADLLVNFFEISPYSNKISLPNLSPTSVSSGLWYHEAFQTNLCSGSYPCQGYFTIEPLPLSGTFAVAIDDIDYDGRCHGSIPCCYFDDIFLCDFILPTSTSYLWQWSGPLDANYPTVSIPNPGSDFIFFEVPTATAVVASVPLSSDLITIPQNVVFQGKFFARTPFGQAGIEALQLNFIEATTLTVTTMEFVKDTSNGWLIADFYCFSIHGDCCQGMTTCTGYLEFTATVQEDGGPLIYGIDAFGVKAICPIPNPSMSHNITSIPLHVKGF